MPAPTRVKKIRPARSKRRKRSLQIPEPLKALSLEQRCEYWAKQLYKLLTEKQKEILIKSNDKHRAALIASRRAGKSYLAAIKLLITALKHKKCNVIYIGLSREQAKRIILKPVLLELLDKLQIPYSHSKQQLSVTLPNDSEILIYGVEKSDSETAKLRGLGNVRLVVVDEAAYFRRVDLEDLCNSVVGPSLAETNGQLILCSTPSIYKNYFYDIIAGNVSGWDIHRFSYKDNPFVCAQVEKHLKNLIEQRPEFKDTIAYKLEYLAELVEDISIRCYSNFDRGTCLYDDPYSEQSNLRQHFQKRKARVVLGVDLGWHDATSFSVLVKYPEDETIYVHRSYQASKRTLDWVAKRIIDLDTRYGFNTIVVDTGGGGKLSVESIKSRYGLNLKAAQKTEKANHMMIMNEAFAEEKLKLNANYCTNFHDKNEMTEHLIEQLESLEWCSKAYALKPRVFKENSSCENHCTDSLLYAFRELRGGAIEKKRELSEHEKMFKQTLKSIKDKKKKKWWERKANK